MVANEGRIFYPESTHMHRKSYVMYILESLCNNLPVLDCHHKIYHVCVVPPARYLTFSPYYVTTVSCKEREEEKKSFLYFFLNIFSVLFSFETIHLMHSM